MRPRQLYLFGGPKAPWKEYDFYAVDDRVRGGKSQSHLLANKAGTTAKFYGTLDTTALKGAGFACQRTVPTEMHYDLSQHSGLTITTRNGDGKLYNVHLKTGIAPTRPDGHKSSSVSYRFTFLAPQEEQSVFAPWDMFEPYYHGKPCPDAPPMDLSMVRNVSLTISSSFGEQSGDFEVTFVSIVATRKRRGWKGGCGPCSVM